jgi:hypothetical protein
VFPQESLCGSGKIKCCDKSKCSVWIEC